MKPHPTLRKALNTALPLLLGTAILWWMYRHFDFSRVAHVLLHELHWGWMAASLLFGVSAQVARGLRWPLALAPLGERPRAASCVHAVFVAYAARLVIPRVGEVTRCGVLARHDGTSFAKSLGTVVAERAVDTLLILLVTAAVFAAQLGVLTNFLHETGTDLATTLRGFSTTGYAVTALCLAATAAFLAYALRRFAFLARLRQAIGDVKSGVLSLRHVERPWLFALYTAAIWASYFLHYYLTFQCFDFTRGLSLSAGLVSFVVGSVAVVVPTPNGMGPWHFATKTILVLYGVAATQAETFVLIVHAVHTALIPLLGVVALIALSNGRRARA